MTLADPPSKTATTAHDRSSAAAALRSPWSLEPARSATLNDLFMATAQAWPLHVALDAPDGTLSYAELLRRSDDLAGRLREHGVGAGDRVGIRLPSGTAELYVAILGTLRAGATYVPVEFEDPEQRASWAWAEAEACAVIRPGLAVEYLGRPLGDGRRAAAADDAWIIFTSGSTGRPKAVAVTHRSAVAFVRAERRLWTVGPTDRVLAGLSVGFDASCEEMWLAWGNGATLVPAPRQVMRSGVDLGAWLATRHVTVLSTVPSLASLMNTDDLSGLRLLVLGGEACPQLLGWALAEVCETWNTYGPTEATVVTTAGRIRPGEPVTIGRPLPGWEVAVVDNTEAPVAPGEAGQLVIAGAGLARYLDRDLDSERFAPLPALGWPRAYRSGDLVRQLPSGEITFLGRSDDQVKVGGRRIDLGEITCALQEVPGVDDAVTVLRENPSGARVIVGYVTGAVAAAEVRQALRSRLPEAMLPVVIPLERMPLSTAGKVDRARLPWPPPQDTAYPEPLDAAQSELAGLWQQQLGVRPTSPSDDFFALGGSSLAAARLVSELRSTYPSVAVSDVYENRTLGGLSNRLDNLSSRPVRTLPRRHRDAGSVVPQLVGLTVLLVITAPVLFLTAFAYNDLFGGPQLPHLAWPWWLLIWGLFESPPGRIALLALAKRGLLRGLRPGRYPRRSWTAARVWFVDRLADVFHVETYGGTPWALRIARFIGSDVGEATRLATMPPAAALLRIGAGVTIEADADLRGWYIDADDLVIDAVTVEDGARVGARALLMPGARIGRGAEIEPGAVVSGPVRPHSRWSGAPAREVGEAGTAWPAWPAPAGTRWLPALYAVSSALMSLLPMVCLVGAFAVVIPLGANLHSPESIVGNSVRAEVLVAALFVAAYALAVALAVRLVSRLIEPGWHSARGVTAWASWCVEELISPTRSMLFPLYSSLWTGRWLRLMGMRVGEGSEISTAVGLGPLVQLGRLSFLADDVVFNTARARGDWLHLGRIDVGDASFIGNGAIVAAETQLAPGTLVGVQTTPPARGRPGAAWFGLPALEFPRPLPDTDVRRTTQPSRGRRLARMAMETVRILVPLSTSFVIADGTFLAGEVTGRAMGGLALVLLSPVIIVAAGITATAVTVAAKWVLVGRYRAGEHPLWSGFVWRDEIMNTCQELLAGAWLLDLALGTPVMSAYLRLMGSRVGKNVWVDTLTITEFDMVTLGAGTAVNRRACIETHLFHDRVMRIGPIETGDAVTVGPSSAVLPDVTVGAGCRIGGRSVVLRGERLPSDTAWHGAPVVAE